MKSILAAVQFLTILPVWIKTDERNLGRSIPWFPLAGLCIGAGAALVYGCAIRLNVPVMGSAVLGIAVLAILSGGLHLDGLADSADGLFSHRSRERILEIMRDSRIGTMGVLALFFVLAMKTAALAAMVPSLAVRALMLAPVAARAAVSLSLVIFPYARLEGGLAGAFMEYRKRIDVFLPIVMALLAGWLCLELDGIVVVLACLLVGTGFSIWCRYRLGGITGDTLGAVSEITETLSLLVASVLL